MGRFLFCCLATAVLALPAGALLPGGAEAVAWAQEELEVGGSAIVSGTEREGLRLRSAPGLAQRVQLVLADGVRVQVVEGPQTADGQPWFRVSAPAGSGWASARYLVAVAVEERATLLAAAPLGATTLPMRVLGYHIGGSPRTTTGTTPRWGTVAVDPRVIPLGSRLLIEGFEGTVFVAEDTGSAIRGNIVDVWFDDPAAARRFGTQTRTVTVLGR